MASEAYLEFLRRQKESGRADFEQRGGYESGRASASRESTRSKEAVRTGKEAERIREQAERSRKRTKKTEKQIWKNAKFNKKQWKKQQKKLKQIRKIQLPLLKAQQEAAREGVKFSKDFLKQQQEISNWYKNVAQQDRQRYEQVFKPLEDQLVQEARTYDTAARREEAAGAAASDVARAQDAQRKASIRNLESYGIDPSQTRSQALDASLRTVQAANRAAAANQARRDVEARGQMLRAAAADLGTGTAARSLQEAAGASGAAGQGATQAGLLAGQAAQGVQTGRNLLSDWQNVARLRGTPLDWTQAANQTSGLTTDQYMALLRQGLDERKLAMQGQQFNRQMEQQEGGPLDILGGLAGTAVGAWAGGGFPKLFADGGEVYGPGTATSDSIEARLSDGEYVMPTDVVRRKGTEFFDKLIDKTHKEMEERRQFDEKHANQEYHMTAVPDNVAIDPHDVTSDTAMFPDAPHAIQPAFRLGGPVAPYSAVRM